MDSNMTRRQLLRTAGYTLTGAALLAAHRFDQHPLWARAQAQTQSAVEPLHICIDRPNEGEVAPADAHLVGFKSRFWPTGSTLRVRFLNGAPVVRNRVEEIAHEWSQYANLKFVFGDDRHAEIRISFIKGDGSWSYVGSSGHWFGSRQWASMNFGWLYPTTPLDEYRRVVLHEFGHALGLVHEHQSPVSTIAWNKEAVYAYFAGPPQLLVKRDGR